MIWNIFTVKSSIEIEKSVIGRKFGMGLSPSCRRWTKKKLKTLYPKAITSKIKSFSFYLAFLCAINLTMNSFLKWQPHDIKAVIKSPKSYKQEGDKLSSTSGWIFSSHTVGADLYKQTKKNFCSWNVPELLLKCSWTAPELLLNCSWTAPELLLNFCLISQTKIDCEHTVHIRKLI